MLFLPKIRMHPKDASLFIQSDILLRIINGCYGVSDAEHEPYLGEFPTCGYLLAAQSLAVPGLQKMIPHHKYSNCHYRY